MEMMAGENRVRERFRFDRARYPRRESGMQLFERCWEVQSAAQRLERAAGSAEPPSSVAPSLGCLAVAFESLANASLQIRRAALSSRDAGIPAAEQQRRIDEIDHLLFTLDQSLRYAAEASELSRQSLESMRSSDR